MLNGVTTTVGGGQTNNLQIGDVVTNFTSNKQAELDAAGIGWIYFGTDENGNQLLTTSKPIENGYALKYTAQEWLTIEDENSGLNMACAQYTGSGATKARSITMEDINRVTGFVEPEFDTYYFRAGDNDYEHKQVNYWYPSKTAEGYWQEPTNTPQPFKCNGYWLELGQNEVLLTLDSDQSKAIDITSEINIDKLRTIIGENSDYNYIVASRSVLVDRYCALYCVAGVDFRQVSTGWDWVCVCGEELDETTEADEEFANHVGIRPIIVLSSTYTLEKQ